MSRLGSRSGPAEQHRVIAGRVVQTGAMPSPFTAVLDYQGGGHTDHPFATQRAAEAFIRSELPMPAKPDRRREVQSSV